MYVLKIFLLCYVFFLFVSCAKHPSPPRGAPPDEGGHCSWVGDRRCEKIKQEILQKIEKAGACYSGPLNPWDEGYVHPDPEACNALRAEHKARCDALPPPGPNDIEILSGSTFYKDGKPIMIDGKRVCVPD